MVMESADELCTCVHGAAVCVYMYACVVYMTYNYLQLSVYGIFCSCVASIPSIRPYSYPKFPIDSG